mgnify:CR=1 FL=1
MQPPRCPLAPAGSLRPALLLAVLLFLVRGESSGRGFPAASRVIVDGRAFFVEESGNDDFHCLIRLYEKYGLSSPGDADPPESDRGRHGIFSARLGEAPSSPPPALAPLPKGLVPEHSLRLESGSGPVDLLVGKMDPRGAAIRHRLVAEGWTLVAPGENPGRVWILERETGGERAIVCLDEAEGAFLLLGEDRR